MKSSLMTPDWSRVTLEHVRRACEMYDSGAAQPKRPAQSTFLLLNGKTYPAKFIRGLAYRLAMGVEIDPNRGYSGGAETARFFQGLGLATQQGPSSLPGLSDGPPMAGRGIRHAPPDPRGPLDRCGANSPERNRVLARRCLAVRRGKRH
jgi:hypothetical protein